MSVILYAGKRIDVFTQPIDPGKIAPDNALIMGDGGPLDSPGISADRRGDLYFRLQPHGKIPAARDFLERAQGFVKG